MQHDEKDPLVMWMKELSNLDTSKPLPEADLIWLKAQLVERTRPRRRVTWMDLAPWVPASLALLWLATHLSDIGLMIEQAIPIMLPMPLVTIAAILVLAGLSFAVPPLLSHD